MHVLLNEWRKREAEMLKRVGDINSRPVKMEAGVNLTASWTLAWRAFRKFEKGPVTTPWVIGTWRELAVSTTRSRDSSATLPLSDYFKGYHIQIRSSPTESFFICTPFETAKRCLRWSKHVAFRLPEGREGIMSPFASSPRALNKRWKRNKWKDCSFSPLNVKSGHISRSNSCD